MLDLVFKITPTSDHVAKFRGDLALNRKKEKEKRKKETAAKHYKGRVCVITQGAALIKNPILRFFQTTH